jgi:uncharacterized protein (DUF488 family)
LATSPSFDSAKRSVWTIGHSTRTFASFADLLDEHRIECLADIRRFPTSARVGWSVKVRLEAALHGRGIRYDHFEALGGFRSPRPDSPNVGWRNASFRAYADHIGSTELTVALDRLITTALGHRTAVMCAEAVPWKCHRSLLADVLLLRGFHVVHVLAPGKTQDHRLTRFAAVRGGRLTYPSQRKVFKPPSG